MNIPEELIRFVQVLVEDDDLRAWFESFKDTPNCDRALEFRRLAARMQSASEDPELIRATALLADETIYEAVWKTLNGATEP